VIEFRFGTEKALLFRDALVSIGAQPGTAPGAHSVALPASELFHWALS
jgi:hypothetical protein